MVITSVVTGGSGFTASHLVQQLLQQRQKVHATVRSLSNEVKSRHLKEMQAEYPGQLELFEADLLVPGSFDAAMCGCSAVHHVASPFLLPEKIRDGEKQLIWPALEGTRNVLSSVDRTDSVSRVVLTSTIGAIFGDYSDVLQMRDQTLAEEYVNTTSTAESNPYHYTKVLAETEAWRLCGAQTRWSLVAINPGMC
jgi:dihydroflavonol-4-reductase